ncbi:DUF167 family protein YggU [Paraglaciecola chathamensis]|jgi:uncharacterized protein (TIGR00251 family)|uniref:UPF0235 protein GCM10011274_07060 n=1 Tax=Paraglaciecola chathamensis TaxID=368405 RepID=A0A8H9LZN0_9ALTE|nr:DUF167 family protein YggU [Paraglaciecola oceanifecundans]GGZ51705.1 UPF0235 protein YggU [Paraglaciecola oceanifecundans]
MNYAVQIKDAELQLRIYIQPKASRDEIVGMHGDALKIAITAPPVDGKANAHLCKYLAKQCGVAKSKVAITKGQLNRHKTVVVCEPAVIPEAIQTLLNE